MILDLFHDERIDESETLTFEIPVDDPKAYLIADDADIRWRGRWFFVYEIEDTRDESGSKRKTVRCNALWYRLLDPFQVGSLVLSGVTAAEGLATILGIGGGWTAGSQTSTASTLFSMERQDMPVLGLLREWAKITGLFLVWNTDSRTVDLTANRGADRGVAFRYRRNLRRIRRRTRAPEATVLFPYGAQGLTVAGLNGGSESIEDFTFYTDQGLDLATARERFTRERVWSDSSFIVDAELLAAAQARLAKLAAGLVTYELSVVDLSELTGIAERVELGDIVHAVDEDLGANIETTVVRHRQYPLEPWRDEVELGQTVDVLASTNTTHREATSESWTLFRGPALNDFNLRNDFVYTVARIPLRFRAGGQAHYHLDVFATGVGIGTLTLEVIDALTGATVHRALPIPYTNGQLIHGGVTWSDDDIEGSFDYRLRMTAATTGGADPVKGANLLIDDVQFYILAIGAVQETPPPGVTELRFDYTGALQYFAVPDFVTEVEVEVVGAAGGGINAGYQGRGGSVVGSFAVTALETIVVEVGQNPSFSIGQLLGGWPNGGNAGKTNFGAANGAGGGGSSAVYRSTFAAALVVAPGGGGMSERGDKGGDAGFFLGVAGLSVNASQGGGATQASGGAGGPINAGTLAGQSGAANLGGYGGQDSSASSYYAGGGGGGWYGGGGGGGPNGLGLGNGAGAGGGGSGWVAPSLVFDWIATDLANDGNGYVIFRWSVPT